MDSPAAEMRVQRTDMAAHLGGAGSPRLFLREATAQWHDRVDLLARRFRLDQRDEYCQFLCAHAAALIPLEYALSEAGVEAVLPDWRERGRTTALLDDLRVLNGHPQLLEPPVFTSPAATLGAVYVLEGSRLGAAILLQSVPSHFPTRYLSHGEDAHLWSRFLANLELSPDVRACRAAAKAGAVAAFSLFERALRDTRLR